MGKTKERAWRNTYTHPLKNMPTQKAWFGYNISKTKEHASRNTKNRITKKKLKPMRKLPDDGGDVELFDPRQEHCDLVEISSSDSVCTSLPISYVMHSSN
ncbi:hypothetical protein M8C21_010876 [Ambrosia artemisiifolia]|uniref:Uncharacterized protein n=1 Tax=Ambrosia artemisiifolia TaxID=4212 RepID=A0AAD5C5Y3_AMBAR|nr:hypothetical protein M8C21_010876 [Ambrosia artemisiifolia]